MILTQATSMSSLRSRLPVVIPAFLLYVSNLTFIMSDPEDVR